MGTRSLTRVNSGKSKILNMYRQFDGYLSGHGKELFDFLDGMKMINGISGQKAGEAANGAGCLAAQLVSKFKTGIGEFYLYPVDATDCGQEYEYVITITEAGWEKPGVIDVSVLAYGKTKFTGDVAAFGEFIAADANNESDD